MLFDHAFNDAAVYWYFDLMAAKTCKVLHCLTLSVCRDDHLNVLWEVFRQPECNIAFPVGLSVDKVIDSFKDQDDLFVDNIGIVDYLAFDGVVTDLEPI